MVGGVVFSTENIFTKTPHCRWTRRIFQFCWVVKFFHVYLLTPLPHFGFWNQNGRQLWCHIFHESILMLSIGRYTSLLFYVDITHILKTQWCITHWYGRFRFWRHFLSKYKVFRKMMQEKDLEKRRRDNFCSFHFLEKLNTFWGIASWNEISHIALFLDVDHFFLERVCFVITVLICNKVLMIIILSLSAGGWTARISRWWGNASFLPQANFHVKMIRFVQELRTKE